MTRDPAKRFFHKSVSDSERAAFEAGIALASILHQFQGMPLPSSRRDIRLVERVIKKSTEVQPFRKSAEIKLKGIKRRRGVYGYTYIQPTNMQAVVKVSYGSALVVARLKWIKRLNYPLMFIEEVHKR